MNIHIYIYRLLLVAVCLTACVLLNAQEVADSVMDNDMHDTLLREDVELGDMPVDRVEVIDRDSVPFTVSLSDRIITEMLADSVVQNGISQIRQHWIPNPKKALWLALAFPGGGQIYNKKYWKLPIFYGGFLGCVYALNWNNTMYRDYSKAYIDIMDNDENTKSYENFIPKTYDIQSNMSRLQELFKRKKDFYRRYRDLSMFCMIGVYLLSVVDAYVDAELSSFDISPDLSMKFKPAIINDHQKVMRSPNINGSSYGLQCSLSF